MVIVLSLNLDRAFLRIWAALLITGGLLDCPRNAFANLSVNQEGLLIRCKQDGPDRIKCEATNQTNRSVHFSVKVIYTYKTLDGTEHTDGRMFDGSLEPNQFSDEIGTVMESNIRAQSVTILYATNQ